jgi:hypothetical protein
LVRQGRADEAREVFETMIADPAVWALIGDCEKFEEAHNCAAQMAAWREANRKDK